MVQALRIRGWRSDAERFGPIEPLDLGVALAHEQPVGRDQDDAADNRDDDALDIDAGYVGHSKDRAGEVAADASGAKNKFLVIEMSSGQMVEDVMLAVNGKSEVDFYGRMGGGVPSEEDVLARIEALS